MFARTPEVDTQTWLERVMRKRIVLHTKYDQTFDGTLWEKTADGVILRAANLVEDDGRKTPLAGEVWIPREAVAFAQLDE